MPYHVIMYGFRKPSLSPEDFRSHYETVHIPLVQSLAGSSFPISHTRRYIQRQQGKSDAPVILQGSPADGEWDVLIELVFESEARFFEFGQVMASPDVAARIAKDCDKFLEQSRSVAVVIGQVDTTTGL